jgi:hypothetical protein
MQLAEKEATRIKLEENSIYKSDSIKRLEIALRIAKEKEEKLQINSKEGRDNM